MKDDAEDDADSLVEGEDVVEVDPFEDYVESGQSPFSWHFAALQLIGAANVLRRQLEVQNAAPAVLGQLNIDDLPLPVAGMPMFLLYGLGLENLAKALLVARGADATRAGKLSGSIKSHDLCWLLERARFVLSAEDRDILQRVADVVTSGKYPVGTTPEASYTRRPTLADLPLLDRLLRSVEGEVRAASSESLWPTKDLLRIGLPRES